MEYARLGVSGFNAKKRQQVSLKYSVEMRLLEYWYSDLTDCLYPSLR